MWRHLGSSFLNPPITRFVFETFAHILFTPTLVVWKHMVEATFPQHCHNYSGRGMPRAVLKPPSTSSRSSAWVIYYLKDSGITSNIILLTPVTKAASSSKDTCCAFYVDIAAVKSILEKTTQNRVKLDSVNSRIVFWLVKQIQSIKAKK